MIESLRSPAGRIAIGIAASAMIVALTLVVSASMVALAPLLLLPVWASLFADTQDQHRPTAVRLAIAGGLAAFVAAVVVYVVLAG